MPERFIVAHEEQLVFPVEDFRDDHRAAECAAVLVPLEGILRRTSRPERIVLGVHLFVPQELKRRPVVLVAAALGQHVDLRRRPAELSRINTCLHLEFLQRVNRRLNHEGVEVRIGVLHTVQRIVVERATLPAHRNAVFRPETALPRTRLAGRREPRRSVRSQRNQLQVVAPIQRQLHNALVLDHRAQRRILCRQQRHCPGNFNRFRYRAHRHIKVQTHRLLNLHFHLFGGGGFKTLLLRAQVVQARRQRGETINARIVRGRGTNGVSRRVGNRHCYSGNVRAGCVANLAGNFTKGLAERGQTQKQAHECPSNVLGFHQKWTPWKDCFRMVTVQNRLGGWQLNPN